MSTVLAEGPMRPRERAKELGVDAEIAIIKSIVDPAILEHLHAHGVVGPRFIAAAARISELKSPGSLVGSGVSGWPLVAWRPELCKAGFKADVQYARREVEQIARHACNGWLGSRRSVRGGREESNHPEYGPGWSTTGTVGAK